MKNILVTDTRIINITFTNETAVTIEAIDYDWYYGFFRVFADAAMDFFDRDSIEDITVDGDPIDLPS